MSEVVWGDCVGGLVASCCDEGGEPEDCVVYGPNGQPVCEHGVPAQACEDIQDDDESNWKRGLEFLLLYFFFVGIIVLLVYWLIQEAAK